MQSKKLSAGQTLPHISVAKLSGGELSLFSPDNDLSWRMVVVYRGKHCPICTHFLSNLNTLIPQFNELGVDVVAVSADSEQQTLDQTSELNLDYEIGYELSIAQMQELGLYISDPRSPEETDHPFPEPAVFVANENNQLQIVDVSNAPFIRPDLELILRGLRFIRNPDNNYPIRGMHS